MNLKNLISQLKIVQKKYEEIAILKKDAFNIFKILGITSDEVRLHSRFLVDLLNPNGSHLMGDTFLNLWLQQILPDFNFVAQNIKIEAEKSLNTGRRLDIILTNSANQCIIIENKIYASDQPNQMYDYHQYAKNYKDFRLLYLNLFGTEPNKTSTKNLKKDADFFCISYENDISIWLEKCQKEAFDYPLIRETLKQYQATISHLTNKNYDNNYMREISQLLGADQNYLLVSDINEAFKQLKINALAETFEELERALRAEGLQVETKLHNKNTAEAARAFYTNHKDIKYANFTVKTNDPNTNIALEINQTIYIILTNQNSQHLSESHREEIHKKTKDIKWIKEGSYYYARPNMPDNDLNFFQPNREHLKIYMEAKQRSHWCAAYAQEIKKIVASI